MFDFWFDLGWFWGVFGCWYALLALWPVVFYVGALGLGVWLVGLIYLVWFIGVVDGFCGWVLCGFGLICGFGGFIWFIGFCGSDFLVCGCGFMWLWVVWQGCLVARWVCWLLWVLGLRLRLAGFGRACLVVCCGWGLVILAFCCGFVVFWVC